MGKDIDEAHDALYLFSALDFHLVISFYWHLDCEVSRAYFFMDEESEA